MNDTAPIVYTIEAAGCASLANELAGIRRAIESLPSVAKHDTGHDAVDPVAHMKAEIRNALVPVVGLIDDLELDDDDVVRVAIARILAVLGPVP